VTLFVFKPADVAVTLTLNVQEALAARVAPLKLTVPEPAVAIIVPPPHDPVSPFGVETTSPAGKVSVNAMLVAELVESGFIMVKLRIVLPPTVIVVGEKLLLITGGSTMVKVVGGPSKLKYPVPPLAAIGVPKRTVPEVAVMFENPVALPA
jgi:hypothetical protein